MRISIFTDGFPPYISGVSTAVVSQATCLAGRGHEVMIIHPSPSQCASWPPESQGGIQTRQMLCAVQYPLLNGLWLGVPTFARSSVLVERFAPDIIHLHSEAASGLEGLIVSRFLGVPVVGNFSTFFADKEYLRSFNFPSGPFSQRFVWGYQRWFFNHCDRVIAPSKVVRDLLRDRNFTSEIEIISNGVAKPPAEYEYSPSQLRHRFACSDTFNVLYVGRVSREKSLDVALSAFDMLYKRYPRRVKFVIIGDGNYMHELRRRVNRADNREQYVLLGEIPHDRLIESGLFRLGDVFVMPSKTETEGIAAREAMAFGLPVIAVSANASLEVVTHGFDGFLATPDCAEEIASFLEESLLNPQRRLEMDENAIQTARKHEIGYSVTRIEQTYSSVLRELSRATRNMSAAKKRYTSAETKTGIFD